MQNIKLQPLGKEEASFVYLLVSRAITSLVEQITLAFLKLRLMIAFLIKESLKKSIGKRKYLLQNHGKQDSN